jgi:hypothetical protein
MEREDKVNKLVDAAIKLDHQGQTVIQLGAGEVDDTGAQKYRRAESAFAGGYV